ncbi:hypothetical protein C8K63_108172 [Pseudomonas sp. GV085]|nr:hypothetical protein C8K63_108172 [Pseudomonas sp. GV085]
MSEHEKSVPLNKMHRDKRLDPEQRKRMDAAIHMQGCG